MLEAQTKLSHFISFVDNILPSCVNFFCHFHYTVSLICNFISRVRSCHIFIFIEHYNILVYVGFFSINYIKQHSIHIETVNCSFQWNFRHQRIPHFYVKWKLVHIAWEIYCFVNKSCYEMRMHYNEVDQLTS